MVILNKRLTYVVLHVKLHLLLIQERRAAHPTWEGLELRMRAADVAVVGGVRREGLPAVLTLERPLARVLADVRPQNTGGSKGLKVTKMGKKQLGLWKNI